ncbi:hypothetical protein [Falsibacillus pallidus]|uniref:hypothetical protein n=1 Tax=Falsibacillus pallidus TaxID=493781 RepID=UPI003D95B236
MRSKLSSISFILFLIAVVSYLVTLLGLDKFLIIAVLCSAAGFVIALFSKSGMYKTLSLFGNGFIIFIAILIPFVVTTFIWTGP